MFTIKYIDVILNKVNLSFHYRYDGMALFLYNHQNKSVLVLTSCEVVALSDVAASERHDLKLGEPLSSRLWERQHVPQVADLTVDQVPALLRGTLRRPNR